MPSRTGSVMSEPLEDFVRKYYPLVDESNGQVLPRCWSSKDKFPSIGLSQDNRRIHYKGQGKTTKDAGAVRATNPIPPLCGVYYYEVKIVSKGRDGYMGIGFSQQGVSLNRLPGWDKGSYGYHGDDGYSFCSSGVGQPYGPTFTTGDVIGCGLNLIDRSCFYTKNGLNIGVAFTGLPSNLYPSIGLQTPGEVVEANFGQEPFLYDFTQDLKEAQTRLRISVQNSGLLPSQLDLMPKLILGYLTHHGFAQTAHSFSKARSMPLQEDQDGIKTRQRIKELIFGGNMKEALELIQEAYPDLLKKRTDLMFMLKCRQFVEMINSAAVQQASVATSDGLQRASRKSSSYNSPSATPPHKAHHLRARHSPFQSPQGSPRHPSRGLSSSRHTPNRLSPCPASASAACASNNAVPVTGISGHNIGASSILSSSLPLLNKVSTTAPSAGTAASSAQHNHHLRHVQPVMAVKSFGDAPLTRVCNGTNSHNGCSVLSPFGEESMDCSEVGVQSSEDRTDSVANGVFSIKALTAIEPSFLKGPQKATSPYVEPINNNLHVSNGHATNGCAKSWIEEDGFSSEDDFNGKIGEFVPSYPVAGWSQQEIVRYESILEFGRELLQLSKEMQLNQTQKTMLEKAYALLAYANPRECPLSYQLHPSERQPIAAAVNSAILESQGFASETSLEVLLRHAESLRTLSANNGMGAPTFLHPRTFLRNP